MMTLSVVLNFVGGILFVVSAWYLPAALVQGFMDSCTITFSSILAKFRKKCTTDLPFAILLCYTGCLLLLQPFGIFDTDAGTTKDKRNCSSSLTFQFSRCQDYWESSNGFDTLYGFLSVICLAVCLWIHSQFNVEYLNQWVSVITMLFWIGIGCAALSLPVLGFVRQPLVLPSPGQIMLALLLGAAFTCNSFSIMYAVTLIPLSHVAVVLPSGLVFLYIF